MAASLNNLALLYKDQGKYADAEPLYQRALAIWEDALGPAHPDVATSLNNLAGLYYAQGQYAEAEPLYRRALAIWEKALGPEHPKVAANLNNLADSTAPRGSTARQSRSTGAPWRSGRRPSDQSIPTWDWLWRTWLFFTTRKAYPIKPNRSLAEASRTCQDGSSSTSPI